MFAWSGDGCARDSGCAVYGFGAIPRNDDKESCKICCGLSRNPSKIASETACQTVPANDGRQLTEDGKYEAGSACVSGFLRGSPASPIPYTHPQVPLQQGYSGIMQALTWRVRDWS